MKLFLHVAEASTQRIAHREEGAQARQRAWPFFSAGSKACLMAVLLLLITAVALIPVNANADISPATLPSATYGVSYSQTFTASGGTAPYSYGLTAGSLPSGMSLSSAGVLSGTPTALGTFNFEVMVSDSSAGGGPYPLSQIYSILVTDAHPSITTPAVANGTVGVSYSQTISAEGGNAPYMFYISSGSLPAGLSLNSNGVISGMPSAGGLYTFAVGVLDDYGRIETREYANVAFAAPSIAVSPFSLPNATQNSAYGQTITASGGTAPYHYGLTVGCLPSGLSLSSTGVLSGTPTVNGSYSFVVTATDTSTGTGPYTSSRSYTLWVTPSLPSITTPAVANGTVGAGYSQTISAEGGSTPYTFSISSGSLPAGLSLSSNGVISGTPSAGGLYTFTVTVTDDLGGVGIRTYANVAFAAPTIALSPSSLSNATQNSAYSQTITAGGGTAPYVYAVTAGSLPSGMSLGSTGVLSGTPTVYGTFNFVVMATDSSTGAGPYTGGRSYTLSVTPSLPSITTTAVANGTVGVGYSQTISAGGGNAPYTFSISSGSLPAGLSLNGNGLLSGTPSAGGLYTFTVTVTDASLSTAARTYADVAFAAPSIALSPSSLPNAAQNSAYSQTITAGGGTAPYVYAVTGGSLPSGMSLGSTGVLSGTPTGYGEHSFTIAATDTSTGTGPYTGSRSYTLWVTPSQPSITTVSAANGSVGFDYSQTISAGGGNAPYTFSISSGSLPAGLSLNSNGVLSGTPSAAGLYTFTVTVTDAAGQTAAKSLSVTVYESGCDIIAFSLAGVNGSVNADARTVTVVVPYATRVNNLVAAFGLSSGAAVKVNGVPQASGTTANDFTNPLIYRVTAQDTIQTKDWTVICKVAKKTGGASTPMPTATPTPVIYMADVKTENSSEATLPVMVGQNTGSAYVDAGSLLITKGGTVITIPAIPDVVIWSVGIPVPNLSDAQEQGVLTLKTGTGSITVPSNMLTGVEGINGGRAEIAIGQADKSLMPADVRSEIGERPLITLSLSVDGTQTNWNNPGAPVTVSIPYTPTPEELASPDGIAVWYVDGSGNAVKVSNGRYDPLTGTVTFIVTHF